MCMIAIPPRSRRQSKRAPGASAVIHAATPAERPAHVEGGAPCMCGSLHPPFPAMWWWDRCHASIPPYMTRATRHVAVGFLVRSTPSDPPGSPSAVVHLDPAIPRPPAPLLPRRQLPPSSRLSSTSPSPARHFWSRAMYISRRTPRHGSHILDAVAPPAPSWSAASSTHASSIRACGAEHGKLAAYRASTAGSFVSAQNRIAGQYRTRTETAGLAKPLAVTPPPLLPTVDTRTILFLATSRSSLLSSWDVHPTPHRAHQTPEGHRRAYGSHVKNKRDESRLRGYSLPTAISPGPEEHPSSCPIVKAFLAGAGNTDSLLTAHADFPILGRRVRVGSLPACGSPEDGNHVEELECRMAGKLGHQRALASRVLSRLLKLYILLGSFLVVALTCPGTRRPTSGDSPPCYVEERECVLLERAPAWKGSHLGWPPRPALCKTYRLADLLTACSSSAASFPFIIISHSRCYPCVSTSPFLSGPERLSSESFGVKIYIMFLSSSKERAAGRGLGAVKGMRGARVRELLSDARLLVWDFGCCRSSACVGLDTRRALACLSLLVTLARKHLTVRAAGCAPWTRNDEGTDNDRADRAAFVTRTSPLLRRAHPRLHAGDLRLQIPKHLRRIVTSCLLDYSWASDSAETRGAAVDTATRHLLHTSATFFTLSLTFACADTGLPSSYV
ncbi:hypothetical protein B0H14DRAFT_3438700 [Mycena olivaceomarginata]|nr:hypothetical protein B0H14DRAFT_3438700 [Mycena olivaceomarginata]